MGHPLWTFPIEKNYQPTPYAPTKQAYGMIWPMYFMDAPTKQAYGMLV